MSRSKRNRGLNDGKAEQVGVKRGRLGAVDRFAQRVAMNRTGDGEQRQRDTRRHIAAPYQQRAKRQHGERSQNFGARHRRPLDVKRDAAHHDHHEGNRQRRRRTMRGGQASDRDNRSQMVDADDRMAEAGQDALHERRRRATAHHVVRKGRCGTEDRSEETQTQTYKLPIHAISPAASLAQRARLDIPCRATDKPQPKRAGASMSTDTLARTIDAAFEARDKIGPRTRGAVRKAVDAALELLDTGKARVAERRPDGQWHVNQWLKKAVLLSFRLNDMSVIPGGPGKAVWWDKVDSKFKGWSAARFRKAGFRAVPGCVVRRSAFIAPGVVLMPSFVNLGAYVDSGTMIDTWATVGSCAQIGKNCHISGGAGIGGVLEPL